MGARCNIYWLCLLWTIGPSRQNTVHHHYECAVECPRTVTGIKSDEASQYKVVVYAYGGDRWYIQPLQDASDIAVDADGRWETETHGGLQFVALLVKSSFKPRTTLETIYQAGGEIIAVARKKSGSK
jgi:hypothetical protein